MAVYKDGDKWRVIYRYTNYKGERKQTQKRGFATKREAVAWEHEVMLKSESKLDMTLDCKGRWRNKAVAFRVSEEEAKLIDTQVALSGLTKQDYIIRRLQCRDVVVQGNPRVYKALRNQMADIYEELKRLESASEANDELLYTIQMIAEIMNGLKGECE